MAIIKCPECKASISNTIDHCVHCGANIITCPECSTAFVKGAEICTECGYEFKKTPRATSFYMEKKDEANEVITATQIVKKQGKNWSFHFDLSYGLAILSYLIGSALLIFGVFIKIADVIKNPLDLLLSDVKSECTAMLIFSMLLLFLGCVLEVISTRQERLWRSNRAKESNTTMRQIIENTLNANYDDKDSDYLFDEHLSLSLVVESDIHERSLDDKQHFTLWATLKITFSAIMCICLYFFIDNNIGILWMTEFFELFSMPEWWEMVQDWWLLGAACIFLLLRRMVDRIIQISEKQQRDWIRKEFPDKLETYDKYLTDSACSAKESDEIIGSQTRGGV